MREIFESDIWRAAKTARTRQRFLGRISAVCLAIALVALFDGLIAEMRGGSSELELLPGQSLTISGPCGLKNPLDSDVVARFIPENAPLRFNLEGFFTGYWFGSGMWRGTVTAAEEVDPGDYEMLITFKGSSAKTAQKYNVRVFTDAAAQREASRMYFRRYLNANPFIIASVFGCCGIILGLLTYFFGRRYALFLAAIGLSEIYTASETDGRIWCLMPQTAAPKAGNARMVVDMDGNQLGEARVEGWHKGKLSLTLLDGRAAPPGALVCLKPPRMPGENISGAKQPPDRDGRGREK